MFSPRGGSSNFDTYSTTATAAGTTTLTANSSYKQFFTGVTTQTVTLPVASTMSLGQQFWVVNDSTGVVTVQSSGANTLQAMAANTEMMITCILLSGTGTASWSWDYGSKGTVTVANGGTGLTSGTSGGVPYFSSTTAIASSAALAQYGVVLGGGAGNAPATLAPSATRNYFLKGSGSSANPAWGPGQVINYMSSNPDAELNDVTSWATFADAASTTPTDGTGGSPNSTWAATSTSPLRGTYSFLWTKSSGASRQGEGVSYDFTIDAADKGQVLQISFDYIVSSGTYVDNAMTVWIYDVTNATLIQPTPTNILNTSISQRWQGTFQTATSSTSYRLILYVPVTTDSSNTLRFDNFEIGPQKKSYGPALTDWTSYTPTGSWVSNCTYSGWWKRIGDSMAVMVRIAITGAPTAADLKIGIPSGYTIDTTKLSSTSVNSGAFGAARIYDSGTAQYVAAVNYGNSTTQVGVTYNGSTNLGWVNHTSPITFANGDEVDVEFVVPIVGWSSGQLLSSDADTRVCAVQLTGTSSSISNGGDAITPTTVVKDTHGAWSTATYTVPTAGWYRMSGYLVGPSAAYTSGNSIGLSVKQNSTSYSVGAHRISETSTKSYFVNGSLALYCVAGDTLQFIGFSTVTGNATNFNASIERVSGPSQIAASELVACKYYASSSSIGTVASPQLVTFSTKDYDTHNCYSSGLFTCPAAGKYIVTANVYQTAATTAANQQLSIAVYKSGASGSLWIGYFTSATSKPMSSFITDQISCVAGDTIGIYAGNDGTTPSINASNTRNYITISRIGI